MISLKGLVCSSAPIFFASVYQQLGKTVLFVLDDADEAGYFYHDLTQMMGQENVFFFPSSYRRAIKYGQKDAANEILRTEVLARLSQNRNLFIVSYPDALAELVVTKKKLDERILKLSVSQEIALSNIVHTLRDFGFEETDYVYEPGQFAVRGSILDVYSYSCEFPFRIDFFGDEIDSIRTFDVESQLSKVKRECIEIVPELSSLESEKQPIFSFLGEDTIVVMKDFVFLHDRIEQIYHDGFSAQSLTEQLEGATEMEAEQIRQRMKKELNLCTTTQLKEGLAERVRIEMGHVDKNPNALEGEGKSSACIHFNIQPQPLFHKNFELLAKTLEDYLLQKYTLYILADSQKQQQRLKDILIVKICNVIRFLLFL